MLHHSPLQQEEHVSSFGKDVVNLHVKVPVQLW